MAHIKNGMSGGYSGKAGKLIGYSVRGKDFIRSIPKLTITTPTEKQLASRAKFRLIQNWRARLSELFAITFKNQTATHSAQNAAHRLNAGIVIGEYPNFLIDPSAVVISKGDLPPVTELEMTKDGDMLHFTWNTACTKTAKSKDQVVILVLYDSGNNAMANHNAANREDGKCSHPLHHSYGKTASVYFTITSNDRQNAANSVYLGEIELGE